MCAPTDQALDMPVLLLLLVVLRTNLSQGLSPLHPNVVVAEYDALESCVGSQSSSKSLGAFKVNGIVAAGANNSQHVGGLVRSCCWLTLPNGWLSYGSQTVVVAMRINNSMAPEPRGLQRLLTRTLTHSLTPTHPHPPTPPPTH
jgi:hypothetical protein